MTDLRLVIEGDPEGCRGVAGTLRTVERRLESAHGLLHAQRRRRPGSFTGEAALSYRSTISPLSMEADVLSRSCGALAHELDRLADRLEKAQEVIGRAVDVAAAHGLVGPGLRLEAPQAPPPLVGGPIPDVDPERSVAHERALALLERARTIERAAQTRWRQRLAELCPTRDPARSSPPAPATNSAGASPPGRGAQPQLSSVKGPVLAAYEGPVLAPFDKPLLAKVDQPVLAAVDEPLLAPFDEPLLAKVDDTVLGHLTSIPPDKGRPFLAQLAERLSSP